MKRVFLLSLLLLCILLTACSDPKGNKDVLANLPPQENVKTDFSVYTPGKQSEYLYTRLSAEPLMELQPIEDATMIYPFIGQDLRLSAIDDLSYTVYPYRYGFADDKGRLLADPIYYNVEPLREYTTNEALPFWVMCKLEDEDFLVPTNPFSVDPIYGFCGLASMDGSVVTECIYTQIYAYEDRIVAYRYADPVPADPDSPWNIPLTFDVYDLKGDLLFSSEDLPFADRLFRHGTNFQYSEGLYVIQLEEEDQIINYFMDEEFRLVLGPYRNADPFSEGLAVVQVTDSQSTYIDKEGNPFPTTYDSCDPFRNGYAIVYSYIDGYSMIDTDGTVVATFPSGPYQLCDGYYSVMNYEDVDDPTAFHGYRTAEMNYCYDSRGRQLWVAEDGNILSPDLVFHYYWDSGSLLQNIPLGTSVKVNQSNESLVGPATDPFVVLQGSNSPFGYRIFTKELAELPYDRNCDPTVFRWQAGVSEDTALALPHKKGSQIYICPDDALRTYPVEEFRCGIVYSDNTAAFTDNICTKLYDSKGKLFFSYPLNMLGD